MDIARRKREENIAEYILYIWQLEDLLRALQFSPEAVFSALVAQRDASDEWKLAALEWYMDIASLLEKEDKVDGGHLGLTLHLVAELNDLHLALLQRSSEDPEADGNVGDGMEATRKYCDLFSRLAPDLPHLRSTLGREDVNDIELAFRALYAAILYRMKAAGASGTGERKDGARPKIAGEVITLVSPVIALLSDIYHRVERGEMDPYN